MERIKNCKHHGKTLFTFSSAWNIWACKKCRIQNVIRCRKKIKTKAIKYKGGKCIKCGYNKYVEALEFHHLDESKKEFLISSNFGWGKKKKELDKCILVCSNCHKEIHAEIDNCNGKLNANNNL